MAPVETANGHSNGHSKVQNGHSNASYAPSHSSENRWKNVTRPYSEADVHKLRGKFLDCRKNLNSTVCHFACKEVVPVLEPV